GESLWQLGRKEEAASVWTDAVQRNPQLVLVNNELAGAALTSGTAEEPDVYEKQAYKFTPNDSLYHWMLARRLQALGMTQLSKKHFEPTGQTGSGSETPNEP